MNRKTAENIYRDKCKELGISQYFEFIQRDWKSDHGRKVQLKCKSCGYEFWTWSLREVFAGKLLRFSCPNCGMSSNGSKLWTKSKQYKEAMQYYVDGHSVAETAKRFNVTKSQINNAVKAQKLTNGRNHLSNESNEKKKEEALQKIIVKLQSFGFDYIDGYSGCDSKVRIRCQKCNTEYTRSGSFMLKGKNIICIECQKRETEIRNEERRRIAKQEAEARGLEREWYRLMHPPKDPYTERHEAFLDRQGVCEICGKPYTVREYVESCGLKKAQDNGVCSDECRRIKVNRQVRASRKRRGVKDNHRSRAKRYGCVYDSSVTLPKLIKRDGLRCAICGEMCDPNDHSWTKYTGAKSPTIDHIVPMAKGGGHTWDNVQVAHAICNSYKGITQKAV